MAYRYKTCKINGKTKLLHRHLMEQQIGRALLPGEHVHHKNGDRWDNRMENLELLTHKDHMHGHKQKHPIVKVCEVCGCEYVPHPTKRKRSKTCSKACSYKLRWINRRKKQPIAAALVRANCGWILERVAA